MGQTVGFELYAQYQWKHNQLENQVYLGHEVSLHGCSSKVQPLLLTLDESPLLTLNME